jgi:hypothetical protein
MYSIINLGGAFLCIQGLNTQFKREGVFTHKFILGLYILVQIACITVEVWAFVETARVITSFKNISDSLAVGDSVEFNSYENYLSNLFNNLFFGSAGSCTAVRTVTFWEWVNNHCGAGLQKSVCLKCYEFSVSSCQADQNVCYAAAGADSYACPYNICRMNMLSWFVDQVRFVEITGMSIIIFQCLLTILVALLIVHHEVKIDLRRGSIMRRGVGQKPKTLGRKRKTIAANQARKIIMAPRLWYVVLHEI